MDGKGRWRDNIFVERLWRSIEYEEVYLHAYDSVSAAREGIPPLGTNGVVTGAAAMGLFDVDSMTVSITRLAPQLSDNRLAACAILAGVASNTVGKVAIAAFVAPRAFGTRVAVASLACIVAGGAAMVAVLSFSRE